MGAFGVNGRNGVPVGVGSVAGLGSQATPPPPASDEKLLLDAGNSSSYPGTGTVWTDISATGGHVGDIKAGVTFVSAGASSYFTFAGGANSWVEIPEVTFLNSATACSVTAWFQLDTTPFSNGTWFSWGKLFDYTNGIWLYGHTQPGIKVALGNSYAEVPALTTFATEVWLNVTVVFDGSAGGDNNDRAQMYVNGSPVTLNTSPTIGTALSDYSTDAKAFIGTWAFNPSSESAFEGKFAYLAVYDKALTSVEAEDIFDSLKGRYGY